MKMLDSKSGLNDDSVMIGDNNAVKMARDSWSSISSLGLQEEREINDANSEMVKEIAAADLLHNHS